MDEEKALEVLKPTISAIPNDRVIAITVPVNVLVRETYDTVRCARVDADALATINYTSEKTDNLEQRAGACQETESLWLEENHCANNAEEDWAALREQLNEAKFDTIHTFKYAYRNDKNVLDAISDIDDGNTHADSLQDASDLVVLGRKHPEPLQAINYDLTKLDDLEKLGIDASNALAIANENRLSGSEAKLLRDKAYTYLKEGLDELRAAGKYLFRKDEKKLKRYQSKYWKRKNSENRKAEVIVDQES
ncbi:hypothetical protein [Marinifilum fragile]|jgi:hypothetical protein|uniref:hypothetical protein n=1 Tax=Marinifilum fragile TaxID=570161 RepID=UPI002AA63BA4|nr:hypothetical protein [Marinifilum fragile]